MYERKSEEEKLFLSGRRWGGAVLFWFSRSLWRCVPGQGGVLGPGLCSSPGTRVGRASSQGSSKASWGGCCRPLCLVLPWGLWLMRIYTNFSFCLSRLNSIDVKYQMWKLGVVFTDNVSACHHPPAEMSLGFLQREGRLFKAFIQILVCFVQTTPER